MKQSEDHMESDKKETNIYDVVIKLAELRHKWTPSSPPWTELTVRLERATELMRIEHRKTFGFDPEIEADYRRALRGEIT